MVLNIGDTVAVISEVELEAGTGHTEADFEYDPWEEDSEDDIEYDDDSEDEYYDSEDEYYESEVY